MIGLHYHETDFHCAHFVAKWYRDKLNITIPIVDEFELSFMRWMRKHFTQLTKPEPHCLVNMVSNNTSHVGIYYDYGVYHNHQAGKAKGAVVHWELGLVLRNYNKVTYWKWSQ